MAVCVLGRVVGCWMWAEDVVGVVGGDLVGMAAEFVADQAAAAELRGHAETFTAGIRGLAF